MSTSEDRRFELTTALTVADMTPAAMSEFASALEVTVRRAAQDVPTITAFFVQLDSDAEILVGLRFEGMDPKYIEDTATEVINASIADLTHGDDRGPLPVREESSLVPA